MRTILLVEDNVALLKTLQSILNNSGFCVIACSDGQTAIEQARLQSIDVMLVDFRMPGLNGADVTRTVRELHPRSQIVGMSLDDRKNEFVGAGANAFFRKPFDIGKLVGFAGSGSPEQECVSQ